MRLIAYIPQSEDADTVRAFLLGRSGVTGVAMRNGHYWRGNERRAEPGFDAIYAPSYPEIRATFAAAGTPAFDCADEVYPLRHEEIVELPRADVVTIICPGKFAREELAEHPPEGVTVAVNEAIGLWDLATYWIANDGFIATLSRFKSNAIRICRRAHEPTLPSGPWYALDRLGVTSGSWTVCCALAVAKAMVAKRIVLIGHDCTVGVGCGTESWAEGHIRAVKRAAAIMCSAFVKEGIAVDHVQWDGTDAYVEALK